MSTIYRRVSYTLKVMLSGSLLGAFLISILLTIIISHPEWIGLANRDLHTLLTLMLIVMPVIAVVIFANCFAEELEEKLLRLLYVYPYKMLYVILEKIAICLICLLINFALNVWVADLWVIALTWDDVIYILWRILPATFFLGALSLFVSLLARNMLAGLGAGFGYWFLDLTMHGQWTQKLYLFQSIWPIITTTQNDNSRFLLFIGSALLTAAILLLHKARTWFI
jgi:ABC-type transport system involved in multi-copper enzyme maturation permease subunit